jgi:hypothetical protein
VSTPAAPTAALPIVLLPVGVDDDALDACLASLDAATPAATRRSTMRAQGRVRMPSSNAGSRARRCRRTTRGGSAWWAMSRISTKHSRRAAMPMSR